ncbi:hypothetical protein GCM10010232_01350 [Streptomyces amakusaensis]|uniref:Maleylpyruvate isomerase N-terminal domain-containing protein n=1 Tax=Streptomyces amakusaensis TaxID=67271 RepID=A0ABW0ARJ1_9ACTN
MSRSAEPGPSSAPASPVTADDLDLAVQLALTALREVPPAAWDAKAGTLEWDRWETVEHLGDDFFAYAVQLGPRKPPMDGDVPFVFERHRPGGPSRAIRADRAAGPAGLLRVLEASGALLVAMVRTTPPQVRAHHLFGASDAEGFAAMGIVEALVHTHDLAQGLELAWNPPADLCARVLTRLFPDAPDTSDAPDASDPKGLPDRTDPWTTLLWATGRAELPGRARLTTWRWDGNPRA